MKIIILIALRAVKFPEGGAAAPVAPPCIRPWLHPVTVRSSCGNEFSEYNRGKRVSIENSMNYNTFIYIFNKA